MSEVKEIKRDVTLNPSGLTPAEHVRETWCITAAFGTRREDIENPSYWAHVAQKLRPKSKIEVFTEDGSFYAEYLVLSSDKTWAKVLNLRFVDLKKLATIPEEQAKTITDGYEIKFRGPKKWSVIRKSDRAVLQEGLHSEQDAGKWLEVHLNAQGIAA